MKRYRKSRPPIKSNLASFFYRVFFLFFFIHFFFFFFFFFSFLCAATVALVVVVVVVVVVVPGSLGSTTIATVAVVVPAPHFDSELRNEGRTKRRLFGQFFLFSFTMTHTRPTNKQKNTKQNTVGRCGKENVDVFGGSLESGL